LELLVVPTVGIVLNLVDFCGRSYDALAAVGQDRGRQEEVSVAVDGPFQEKLSLSRGRRERVEQFADDQLVQSQQAAVNVDDVGG
jgi:hypothetical protein